VKSLKQQIYDLLGAFAFLTVLPIPERLVKDSNFSSSMAYFPLVGYAQGGLLCAFYFYLSDYISDPLLTVLAVVLLYMTNFGFHADGFMDTVDALAGGRTKERRLEIMKDSNVGAIGALFMMLVLLLILMGLFSFKNSFIIPVLFFLPLAGHWSMVALSFISNPAKSEGLASSFGTVSFMVFFTATVFIILPIIYFSYFYILWGLLSVIVFCLLVSFLAHKKFGGVTGDVYGFMNQLAQCVFVVTMSFKGVL